MPKGAVETTRRRQEPPATGIAGLAEVLDGGFSRGGFYLVAVPSSGRKTTLDDQVAYALAATGRVAIYETVRAGTHERMLAHLGASVCQEACGRPQPQAPAQVSRRARRPPRLAPGPCPVHTEVRTIGGVKPEAPPPRCPVRVDNTIVLRYVDMNLDLRRLVSILEMRRARHDTSLREFVIGADGVEVTGAFGNSVAVALSVPRAASEAAPSFRLVAIAQSGAGLGGS